MDVSLRLYKGKLKEALTLVPAMSPEKKVEAVAYWNDLAEQLQEIVHKGNPNYDQTVMSQANSHVSVDEHSTPLYTNPINELGNNNNSSSVHCDNNVIVGLSTNSTANSTMVTTTLKQSTTIQPFHTDNLLDKTIFDGTFLIGSPPVPSMDNCKDHISSGLSMDDKMSPDVINTLTADISSFATAQSDLNCPTGSTSCSNTQTNDANIQAGTLYAQSLKHSNVFAPSQQIDTRKSYNDQLANHNQVLAYLPTDHTNLRSVSISSKHNQNGLINTVGYTNGIVTNSLGCPRRTANMTDEIGNGQFDRGPKLFDEIDEYNHFETDAQTVNPSTGVSAFARAELFTQSDRPLQQIQLFSPNTSDYFNQPSYNFINGTRIKYLLCSICNEQFESFGDLNRHEQLVHSCQPGKETLSTKSISGDIEVDSESFRRLTEVKMETNSSSESEKAITNNNTSGNQHTCEVCGKFGFSTKGNLKRHLRAHSGEKPFKCEYCESCFTEKKSLKIHVRRHTGEKPYKCEICGKLFSQTGVLQSHMALHLNERKFDCQKCGKAFRQRSQLKLHIMRHDGVKRLGCSSCTAKFLTKGDLERHCRTHTGERPYSCGICSKTFTRQQSLNEHMNRHTGRKPYDCKYCERTFSEMSACYKHAKTHKRLEQLQQAVTESPDAVVANYC